MTDEAAIRELIAEWHRATAAGDLDRVLELMAEDVVFLTPGGPAIRGRAAFADGFREALRRFRIASRAEVQEVHVEGRIAYAWTDLSVAMIPREEGDTMRRRGPALTILRKDDDGRWRVIRDANMLAAAV